MTTNGTRLDGGQGAAETTRLELAPSIQREKSEAREERLGSRAEQR